MDDQQVFWMVWKCGGSAPTRQHWHKQDAEAEAERLALEQPGDIFFVLRSERVCRVQRPVEWARCKDTMLPV